MVVIKDPTSGVPTLLLEGIRLAALGKHRSSRFLTAVIIELNMNNLDTQDKQL